MEVVHAWVCSHAKEMLLPVFETSIEENTRGFYVTSTCVQDLRFSWW